MCGRFSLASDPKNIMRYFELNGVLDLTPRYNISPGQNSLTIRLNEKNLASPHFDHWGFIPSWLKEEEIGTKWINARSETLTEKKLFKNSFQRKRCLIVADGFYEWTTTKVKQPYYFYLKNNQPFGIAGIWEHWENNSGKIINSCCILTASANECVSPVHNRMPIIIPKEYFQTWLFNEKDSKAHFSKLNKIIKASTTNSHILRRPVSNYVNNPRHEGIQCITNISEQE